MTLPAVAAAHLQPGERVLWWSRPSVVSVLPPIVSAFAGLVLFLWLRPGGFEDPWAALTGLPPVLFAAWGVLIDVGRRLLRAWSTVFVVTDRRVWSVTSVIAVHVRSIPHAKATHVRLHQGPMGRLFSYWGAHVSSYGEGEERSIDLTAVRDGDGLLRELTGAQRRGANVDWLRRSD